MPIDVTYTFFTEHPQVAAEDLPEDDHCAAAHERLAEQFKASTDLRAMICTFADRGQELEQAMGTLLAYRSLETALGAQLDQLGTTLRLARNGLPDSEYRVRLRARAKVIASRGRADELLDILTTLDDGFMPAEIVLEEHFPACVVLRGVVPAGEQARGVEFAQFLIASKAAGVKIIFEFYEDSVTLFQWAESATDPEPDPDSGWAEDTFDGVGGRWAEAVGSGSP